MTARTPQVKSADAPETDAKDAVVQAVEARLSKGDWGKLGGGVAGILLAIGGWAVNTTNNVITSMAELKTGMRALESTVNDYKQETKSAIGRVEKRMDRIEDRILDGRERHVNLRENGEPKSNDG